MSEQRELELKALRDQCPVSWTRWAREHGSPTLQRALADGYPHAALLRLELLELFCPDVAGAEREFDMQCARLELGDEREPNELSYAMLDRIHTAARLAFVGPRCPAATDLQLMRLRRAKVIVEPGAAPVHASAAGVEIGCGLMVLTGYFIWGRSDR